MIYIKNYILSHFGFPFQKLAPKPIAKFKAKAKGATERKKLSP